MQDTVEIGFTQLDVTELRESGNSIGPVVRLQRQWFPAAVREPPPGGPCLSIDVDVRRSADPRFRAAA
ncbi:hypothetical protein GCM10009828_073600 [Actinoplanes couchii]|uniref:Uncharacterized protein n=1 Tax=Actinoplanes couchii TaxID=403638 RepID=A0ABQ3X0K1_9ACTN|nr:hypothetical protein Aco03nite_003340 [Actinoplanes couchii]